MGDWRIGDLPMSIECPSCGTRNLRTDTLCRKCDRSLDEAKAKMAGELANQRARAGLGMTHEKRIALIPKVVTQRWTMLGWEVMEGSIVLTDKRLVFVPDEIGTASGVLAAAGALGGMVGALVAAVATQGPAEESQGIDRPLDELISTSKRVIEVRYEALERFEAKSGRSSLLIKPRRKQTSEKGAKVRLTLSMPDGFLSARLSEGMNKKAAWEGYCDRCRSAFESSLVGTGVNLVWTR